MNPMELFAYKKVSKKNPTINSLQIENPKYSIKLIQLHHAIIQIL